MFICLTANEDIREAILEFHIFHDEIIVGTWQLRIAAQARLRQSAAPGPRTPL